MLDLVRRLPVGVDVSGYEPLLRYDIAGRSVPVNFDRFRVVDLNFSERAGEIDVTWADFLDLPLNDPFFKSSVDAAATRERAETFRTPQSVISRVALLRDLPFSGAVFHMARTGSTLIHRLLSCTGRVHSLSEISLLDRALLLTRGWEAERQATFLQDLVATFRRARRPAEEHFVTKMTDAGGNVRLPLYRAIFPEVPWIFVYREPVEVMVSILARPTGNVENWFKNRKRAAERLQMPVLASSDMWLEEFVALTLSHFCKIALAEAKASKPGTFLAVSYNRLPDAIWETIAPHFGIELHDRDIDAMRAEATYSAKKNDATEFRPDSEAKMRDASPHVRALAAKYVAPLIEELRSLPQA